MTNYVAKTAAVRDVEALKNTENAQNSIKNETIAERSGHSEQAPICPHCTWWQISASKHLQ